MDAGRRARIARATAARRGPGSATARVLDFVASRFAFVVRERFGVLVEAAVVGSERGARALHRKPSDKRRPRPLVVVDQALILRVGLERVELFAPEEMKLGVERPREAPTLDLRVGRDPLIRISCLPSPIGRSRSCSLRRRR